MRCSRHSRCEGRLCVWGGDHVILQKRHTCHAWQAVLYIGTLDLVVS